MTMGERVQMLACLEVVSTLLVLPGMASVDSQ